MGNVDKIVRHVLAFMYALIAQECELIVIVHVPNNILMIFFKKIANPVILVVKHVVI